MVISTALLVVLASGVGSPTTEEGRGRLCIAAARPPEKIAGQANETGLSVQVDSHAEVPLDFARSVSHPQLELGMRHVVRIRKNGKVVQSFHFRYTAQSTDSFCLFFEPYYAVWQLWAAKDARHICKCAP